MQIAVRSIIFQGSIGFRPVFFLRDKYARLLVILLSTISFSGYTQDPSTIANLEFWLRSDSGVTVVGEKIASWQSIINNIEAVNDNNSRRPTLAGETFTEQEGVVFGGGQTGPYLMIDEVDYDSSFTIYSLFKVNAFNNPVQYLFGLAPGVRGVGITNSNQHLIFFDDNVQLQIDEPLIAGKTYLVRIEFNADTDYLSFDMNFGEVQTEGVISDVDAIESMIIGSRSDFNWSFNGAFADVLFFSRLLNENEKNLMESYFHSQYAPAPGLPDEVILEAFCDTTLTIPDRYQEIVWSTGDTVPSTTISEPGVVSLVVVTVFGDTLESNVSVTYPGEVLEDFSLCTNSDSLWQTNLTGFEVSWQDGSTTTDFLIDSPGSYWFTATDTEGCTFSSDTVVVTEDLFVEEMSITYPPPFCAGNSLNVTAQSATIESYLWNTGNTEPSIIPETEGEYWLEATNDNGCTAVDTVVVDFAGVAPDVQFTADLLCAQQTATFADESETSDGSEIVQTQWIINGDTLYGESVAYTFNSYGSFPINHIIITDVGCAGFLHDTVQVHPLPIIDFEHALPCSNSPTLFEDESTIPAGEIASWNWNFGGGDTANTAIAVATFETPGLHNISLTVTTQEGCADTLTAEIPVHPSPEADFQWSPTCAGNLMTLESVTDTSLTGSLTYAWHLSGVPASGQVVQHTFSGAGTYEVIHEVWTTIDGSSGCHSEETLLVTVSEPPEVNFDHFPACAGETFSLSDLSSPGENDSIVMWQWYIGGVLVDTIPTFEWQFDNPGIYPVTLQVSSFAGCTNSHTDEIEVGEGLPPIISYSPETGLPPFEVQFTNENSYGQSHLWDFGDGGVSEEESPQYTYLDTGIFEVSLLVTDDAGCSGFGTTIVEVKEPYYDISVEEITAVENGDEWWISCVIRNKNNHRLKSASLRMWLGNGTVITESWEGDLARDENITFSFSSGLLINSEVNESYVCVEAMHIDHKINDAVPEDNRRCKALSTDAFIMFNPFPNPATSVIEQWFSLAQPAEVTATISDAIGRVVLEQKTTYPRGLHQLQFNTSAFRQGIYFIALRKNGEEDRRRFMVKK